MIKAWVINIAALVMLVVLIEMLVPSGKLKKMISLVTGFILIIAIISPILGFLKEGGELKELQVSQSAFLDQKELEVSADKLSKKQSAIVVSTFKSKLSKDVEANLSAMGKYTDIKADVTVEEDSESKEFGMIRKITVSLKEKENDKEKDKNEVKPVIAIKRVAIGESAKSESGQNDSVSENVKNEVKSRLSKLYNINSEQIQVEGL